MLPHEWIAPEGPATRSPLKVDALEDGDGHLYPGPTDICWDLAGAIVEWNMSDGERRELSERYASHAGTARQPLDAVLDDYLIAYTAFRAGCLVFATSSANDAERPRLERARTHYTGLLADYVRRRGCEVPERHMGQDGPTSSVVPRADSDAFAKARPLQCSRSSRRNNGE
jgi:hypothetical protein